jgi:hypothetical protein
MRQASSGLFGSFVGSFAISTASTASAWNKMPVFNGTKVTYVDCRLYVKSVNASGVELTTCEQFAVLDEEGRRSPIGTLGENKKLVYFLDQRKMKQFEEEQKNIVQFRK